MTIQGLFDKAKKATETAESAQAMASESILATVEILCNAIAERDKKITDMESRAAELATKIVELGAENEKLRGDVPE